MGGIKSFFSGPKIPKPEPLPPAPVAVEADSTALTEDRLRRQRAAGRQGNIISSLADAVSDTQATSRISRLLG